MKRLCLILAAAGVGALSAQQVVAPTPDQVGPPRGDNTGDYNITQSFETGYRFSQAFGDIGEYRSDVNYGNGIRLLGSSLAIESKDGHGHLFDEILLTTIGLGNDPYQSVNLRIQKNGLYQYNMTWRLDDYYNPGLTVAGGTHLMDTVRRMQDHDLTLLPQSKVRFHLGYSRNTDDGPALSTAQEFNTSGEGLAVFSNIKQQYNEFRIGADGDFAGFHFTVTHRWEYFKEDTPYTSDGTVAANGINDQTVLQQFVRASPLHGRSPAWLGNLFTRRKWWGVNARATYVDGVGDFAVNELASGIGQFGAPATRQIAVGGDAERPDFNGDFNVSLFPTSRLTVSNNTSIMSQRMSGDSAYTEIDNGSNFGTTINFRYLGDRIVTNSTDVDYRLKKWIGFYAGYHYSDRLVRTIEGASLFAQPGSFAANTYNVIDIVQAGTAGMRIQPIQGLTINLEGEIDRANHPLATISPAHYQTLGGRIAYRVKKLQLSTGYKEVYNANPQFGFLLTSSHSRNYTANASWAPNNWFTLDASYSRQHLDSLSFLAFFASTVGSQLVTGSSLYVSNIHSGNLGARFGIGRRADLYLGYSIVDDTGDGRATAVPTDVTNPITALLDSVQTFPLIYESPLARFSFKISPKVRWNVGWQYYDYKEMFSIFGYYQNFHANTGYSSVLWSF
jgi:hypothetical protein